MLPSRQFTRRVRRDALSALRYLDAMGGEMSDRLLELPDTPAGDVLLRTERFEVRRVVIAEGRTRAFAVHPGSVCVLPVLPDGRLVVIENNRATVGAPLLEVVAGTLEPPEPPLTCARRELEEEAGYRAEEIRSLGGFYVAPGLTNEYMHLFLATGLSHVGQNLEAGEEISVRAMTFDQMLDCAHTGKVRDAKTLATLLHYQLFLRELERTA